MINNFINSVRHDFSSQKLDESHVNSNPVSQLEKWIQEAVEAQVLEANAMSVSTVSKDGYPTSRIVYARNISENGLVFYTNYDSQKSTDTEFNKNVSLLFFHPELERQVRINGKIEKLSSEISDAYFEKRPTKSKIGSWASQQSSKIESRQTLIDRIAYFEKKYGNNVPRPPHWGGYIVKPKRFEFWQGRPARLHDRLVFEKVNNEWNIFRVAP